jgi:hypothetical protein
MATKQGDQDTTKPQPNTKPQPTTKPERQPKDGPVRTQMVGEHGDDDIGYDPSIIPTEPIADDD